MRRILNASEVTLKQIRQDLEEMLEQKMYIDDCIKQLEDENKKLKQEIKMINGEIDSVRITEEEFAEYQSLKKREEEFSKSEKKIEKLFDICCKSSYRWAKMKKSLQEVSSTLGGIKTSFYQRLFKDLRNMLQESLEEDERIGKCQENYKYSC